MVLKPGLSKLFVCLFVFVFVFVFVCFFVARLTKEGLLQPPMHLKNKRLRYAYLVPWYSYGSSLSIDTTKYKHPMYDVTMTS